METEIVFSDGLLTALTILFAVCILVPVMYYIWNVYRKRMNHVAMLAGLVVFFFFGYWVSGVLLAQIAPESRIAEQGAGLYALLRALCVAVSEIGGTWLALAFLKRSHSGIAVPIGFGLGFRLFDFLFLGAMNSLLRLSNAMTANREGIGTLIDAAGADHAEALRLQLQVLAESDPKMYWMSAIDYICLFVLSVALARILWYGLEDGKLPADKRLIGLAFLLRFACEFMLAMYKAGGSYKLCAAIYYVLVAGTLCIAYALSRRYDDPEKTGGNHLRARAPRKR